MRFQSGPVELDITLVDMDVSLDHEQEYWSRKTDMNLDIYVDDIKISGPLLVSTEQWMAGGASGGEGWDSSDILEQLREDDEDSAEHVELHSDYDEGEIWELVTDWLDEVENKILTARDQVTANVLKEVNA